MSSSTRNNTSYDERYAVPLEASRRGAHRARRNPILGLLPVVLVAVVVLGVAFGASTVFKPESSGSSSTVAGAGELDDTSTDPSASASATGPAASDTSGSTASATDDSGGATGEADKTVAVKVLNGAGVSGLAAKVQTNLEGEDWTTIEVDTAPERTSRTTIYYGSDAMEATATAMAQDLGYDRLKKNASVAGEGIVVIIGSDYELPS